MSSTASPDSISDILFISHIVIGMVDNSLQGIQNQTVSLIVHSVLLMVVLYWKDAVHGNTKLVTAKLHLKDTHRHTHACSLYRSRSIQSRL